MDRSGRPTLGFIGTGVVAAALSQALAGAGYRVAAVCGRDRSRTEGLARALPGAKAARSRQDVADTADVVFLAVPDDAIASVAASIAWRPGRAAVHCNGAASLDLLRIARDAGAEVGVFHPLQSFARADQARQLMQGSAFRIEASGERLCSQLEGMALALGGHPFTLQAPPTLYHVSAVLASNYLVTLLDLAAGLWPELGVSREDGLRALLPLVRGTIENVERLGIPAALTGPIARGDVGTVANHLDALREVAPHAVPVYKELARCAVQVALAKGSINRDQAQRLEKILSDAGAPAGARARSGESEGGAGCG
jgi:predicted short-subunit dehydrogenase-like oxidoreductase (DUF2520 family)